MALKVVRLDVTSVVGAEGYTVCVEEKNRSNWSNVQTYDRMTGDGAPPLQLELTDEQRIVITPRETRKYRYDPKQKTNVRVDDEPAPAPVPEKPKAPEAPVVAKPPVVPKAPIETPTQKAFREAQQKIAADNAAAEQKRQQAAKQALEEADKRAKEAAEAEKVNLLKQQDAPKQDVKEDEKKAD